MSADQDLAALPRLRKAAMEKLAMSPELVKLLLAGGAGVAAGAIPTALLARKHEQAARARSRNVGFGAGVATGLAGPQIIHALGGVL